MSLAPIDHTHDPQLKSWIESANADGCDFPIQNLPWGRFREADSSEWRLGVAIGDQVLDLRRAGILDHADPVQLLQLSPEDRLALRHRLVEGLSRGSPKAVRWATALRPMAQVRMGLPCTIGDYTDFYVGIHHATAVGRLFRPDNPLLPNYKWVPIGYHGRASTVTVSGTDFHRPRGQVMPAGAPAPVLQPSARLDFELEMGIVVGRGNAQGRPVSIGEAEAHVVGLTLFNDWSARDVQAWEYQPLGPFLSKSFASTLSPWVVTLEALAPFRRGHARPEGDPAPLPYLDSLVNREAGAIDVALDVWLDTAAMRAAGHAPQRISASNYADAAYWTAAQLVAHHTVNGCALNPGDLLGTGTLSGPGGREQAGSMLEISEGGKRPIELPGGERRTFLQDGDRVTFTGRCSRAGYRSIGFGTCTSTVLPAVG